ncbi:toll-like receptor 13 [Coregonus clupeaformis]|uniref:toll-like receptor 13 n=1 Tax=Coregonus clupeaformis TaxID=59861 RepID=UPI001BE05879|nr:toll-like receptor 13 [Coregonus clupeaformis]
MSRSCLLFMLLINIRFSCGYGFKGCQANYNDPTTIWCSSQNIVNVSDVIQNIPENATKINLSKNKIQTILPETFLKFYNLSVLTLDQNKLSSLRGGEFKGLHMLSILNISRNNISVIKVVVFRDLTQLRVLDLSKNIIHKIFPEIFNFLPNIESADISMNKLQSLQSGVYNNTSLSWLSLLGNNIDHLNVSGFPALTYINLSNNSGLHPKSGIFAHNHRLKRLLLMGIETEFFAGIPMETKQSLSMVAFSFSLERSNFTICGLLEVMDSLSSLEINLGRSKLPPNVSVLLECSTPNMVVLEKANLGDLGETQLVQDGRKTKRLYLVDCGLKDISHTTFRSLGGLETLQLNDNKLNIQMDTFTGLRNLTFLSLDRSKIRELNPRWFLPLRNLRCLSVIGNEIIEFIPNTFSDLQNLEELYMRYNVIRYITNQPFSKLSRLVKLDLSLNIIKYIEEGSFRDLENLDYLDLSGNHIKRLTPAILQGLVKLKQLVLYNNCLHFDKDDAPFINMTALESLEKLTFYKTDLDTLPDNLLPPGNSLKVLLVQSNHLHVLEKSLFDNLPMLRFLDISDNPLSCTCPNAWFKSWALNDPNVHVAHIYDLHCDNVGTAHYMREFDDKACSYDQFSLSLFLTTFLLDLVTVTVCLIWHNQKFSIRYMLLLLRTRLRGRKAAGKGRYQYDAFISYSSRDEPWVMRELVARLEGTTLGSAPFRLCLHHRDFRPGTAILENIETAIYNARRTLCVVTRDFLRSEWCALEFQLASLRLLCDGSDVLLMVFLEEIPDYCLSLYTRLRKMVRRKTYLLWPTDERDQEVFWIRLENALRESMQEEDDGDELAMLIG